MEPNDRATKTREITEVYDRGVLEGATVEGNVIHNVSLLGPTSANNRIYTEAAMKDAVRLYEGARVFIDHAPESELRDRRGVRSVNDLAGRVMNPRRTGDRVRGDIQILDREPTKSLMLSIATEMPEMAGMSHRARGKVRVNEQGVEVVEGLEAVAAVEFVAEPATVKGLFEGKGDEVDEAAQGSDEDRRDVVQQAIRDRFGAEGRHIWVESIFSDEGTVVYRVSSDEGENGLFRIAFTLADDGAVTLDGEPEEVRRVTTYEPIRVQESTGRGSGDITEGSMEINDLTLEQLREQRPDLVEAVGTNLQQSSEVEATKAENARLKEELDERKAADAERDRQRMIEQKLEDAKLPETVVTEHFREQLEGAKDEAAVDALIEDRKAVAEAARAGGNGGPRQPARDIDARINEGSPNRNGNGRFKDVDEAAVGKAYDTMFT